MLLIRPPRQVDISKEDSPRCEEAAEEKRSVVPRDVKLHERLRGCRSMGVLEVAGSMGQTRRKWGRGVEVKVQLRRISVDMEAGSRSRALA